MAPLSEEERAVRIDERVEASLGVQEVRRRLRRLRCVVRMTQYLQLLLFVNMFIVGPALIFALGDRDVALQEGAFAMLERMIDGGILLALSTTIAGGIGGYLMRVYKTMSVGAELTRRYDEAARADTSEMRQSLQRIEEHLRGDAA